MKALLVILNKNNAFGLEKCLQSAVEMEGFCRTFDILIMDGGSTDESRQVAEKFKRRYGCIEFRVQSTLGGTGYARNEACEYALKKGYYAVIWGDSENIYTRSYVKNLLRKLERCHIVGGAPIVTGGFYAHAFAWYHSIHLVFPGLQKLHIPGNNRAEKTKLWEKVRYPNTLRSEDYGFSLSLRKEGIVVNQCVAYDAEVYVSLPTKFRDIIKWQNLRAKGTAQVIRKLKVKPYDQIAWSVSLLIFPLLFFFSIFTFLPLIIYTLLYFFASLWIFARSAKYIKTLKKIYFFAPFFGLIVYSYYSLKTLLYCIKKDRA